jgi:uncharacterized protein YndB with AHSA1/START domain
MSDRIMSNSDRIEKRIELKAPVSRVWNALTDYRQFGEWFRVDLESAFVAGSRTKGRITYPGYEHLVMEVTVVKIEPESLFSFEWHPFAIDPKVDYSKEPPTLVEFRLTETASGTLLVVTESGFDAIPPERRDEAFRANSEGWAIQLQNIDGYLGATK